MKLFLDDLRQIPDGFKGVRNYSDCIKILEENKGNINEISLDNDLGETKTGYSVCLWLVENEYFEGLEKIIIHSANPVGIKNMIQLLDRYMPKTIEIFYLNINTELVNVYRF